MTFEGDSHTIEEAIIRLLLTQLCSRYEPDQVDYLLGTEIVIASGGQGSGARLSDGLTGV